LSPNFKKIKMIKKLFTLGLVLAAFAGNAQQLTVGKKQIVSNTVLTNRGVNPSVNSVTVDTLRPVPVQAGGCAISGANAGLYNYINDRVAPYDSGYIFGTGILPLGGGQSTIVTELGQKYNVTGAVTVTDVLVLAGKAHGGTTTTTAKIYTESATTHKPVTALGTSATVPMSAYSTTGYTAFHFATAVAVPAGNFFASVSVPAFGGADLDTLSILSTNLGNCSSVDSCSALKFGAPINGWYLVKVGFKLNGDLMIFPVINITSAGINAVTKGNLSLFAASPNPASNSININFSVEKPSKVEVEIYDITGKIIKTIKNNDVVTGKNAISVDLSNLEAGSYMYSINANGNKMFSKFMVTK
jgi:hypothetical protein